MEHNTYIIHINAADQDSTPPPIPTTVSNLIIRLSDFYRFLGVQEDNLTVKYFRKSAIVTGILFSSPSPRVSIDFSDRTKIKVDTYHVNIEPIFDVN